MKKLLFGLLGLFVLLLAVTFVAVPAHAEVSRTVRIDAPREDVLAVVADLKTWPAWFLPAAIEESATHVGDFADGEGATTSAVTWDDAGAGAGHVRITATRPDGGVDYELSAAGGALTSAGTLTVRAVEGGTEVVWTDRVDASGNPILRWFLLTDGYEEGAGGEMQSGLDRLGVVVSGR